MNQAFKILLLSLSLFLFTKSMQAQVPQKFNYQGIARDAKGNPLTNQKMAIKLAVLPTADATVAEYEETQMINTNEFGLYTLQIGNGTPIKGEMKTVKWETGNKYINIAIDPTGGSNYTELGTNQLLSVPYAIYADKAGTASNHQTDKTRTGTVNSNATHTAGDVNYLSKFTAFNTIGKSLLYDNGNTIGLGTSNPTANAKFHIFQPNLAGNTEFLRMQNLDSFAFGKFLMHNDIPTNYATFTKYGSKYPGAYPGANMATQFPYANLLAFGNNVGPFLLSNNGNVGIGIVSGGSTVLKFNVPQNTGNVGIGGSATPSAPVHLNNNATSETLLLTNNTTGHSNTDGLEIKNTGNAASITNKENSTLSLGTNNTSVVTINAAGNVGIGTNSPTTKLDVNGQVKIQGGNPGVDKVLKSDANGLASWQSVVGPQYAWINNTVNVSSSYPNGGGLGTIVATDTVTWVGGKKLMLMGTCVVSNPMVNLGNVIMSPTADIRVEVLYNGMTLFASKELNTNLLFTMPINVIIPMNTISGQHFSIRVYNNTGYQFPNNVPIAREIIVNVMAIEI